jgi:hypothetical protein
VISCIDPTSFHRRGNTDCELNARTTISLLNSAIGRKLPVSAQTLRNPHRSHSSRSIASLAGGGLSGYRPACRAAGGAGCAGSGRCRGTANQPVAKVSLGPESSGSGWVRIDHQNANQSHFPHSKLGLCPHVNNATVRSRLMR